jgi:hypothetical protein
LAVEDMKQSWKIYRTKYLVKAKQLSEKYTVVDSTGQVLTGEPGDYLVENSDGGLRITRREVFEDVYVELERERRDKNGKTLAVAS